MSYLQNRKIKRKKIKKIVFILIILFFLVYFGGNIFSGFSSVSHTIFKPVLIFGNNIGEKFSNLGAYFKSKKNLYLENERLRDELILSASILSNHQTVISENEKMKEILERAGEQINLVLASILSKPPKSLYDTLVIDRGEKSGVLVGDLVFAGGNVPLGRIESVFATSSKVSLFSSPKIKTEVILGESDIFVEIIGRGGGNFEVNLPRDFIVEEGMEAALPGAIPYTLAKVKTIISDPRDSFIKVLLVSPVNIQELKFVEVEI